MEVRECNLQGSEFNGWIYAFYCFSEFYIKDLGARTAHYFEYFDTLPSLQALGFVFVFIKISCLGQKWT